MNANTWFFIFIFLTNQTENKLNNQQNDWTTNQQNNRTKPTKKQPNRLWWKIIIIMIFTDFSVEFNVTIQNLSFRLVFISFKISARWFLLPYHAVLTIIITTTEMDHNNWLNIKLIFSPNWKLWQGTFYDFLILLTPSDKRLQWGIKVNLVLVPYHQFTEQPYPLPVTLF